MLFSDTPEIGKVWSHTLSTIGIETILVVPTRDTTDSRPEHNYDLIVINLNKGQLNATNLVRHLRSEATVPILLVIPGNDEQCALEAYEAGADECIFKPISSPLFLAKIRAWLRRSWTVPTTILDSFQVGNFRLEPAQRQLVTASNTAIRLTNLEFRLLHLLMSHPGQILESNVIVERVWGHIGDSGNGTLLKNVVYRLRRKIEPDSGQPRYILSFTGEGYMFQP
jgi:DNA-binding response OmpR family regulator